MSLFFDEKLRRLPAFDDETKRTEGFAERRARLVSQRLPAFVIDASIIVSWYSPDEQNDYAKDILFCLKKERAITACLCCLEVNNAFRVLEKKGKVPSLSVDKILISIDKLPIIRDSTSIGFVMPLITRLSREHGLTIYDACYLELAVRLNLPVASLDDDLNKAAKAVNVALKTIEKDDI